MKESFPDKTTMRYQGESIHQAERREFVRVPLHVAANMRLQETVIPCVVCDLSGGGAQVLVEKQQIGAPWFDIPVLLEFRLGTVHRLVAQVRWLQDQSQTLCRYGLEWDALQEGDVWKLVQELMRIAVQRRRLSHR